jgi:sarcosine oxidase gamma subunit
MNRREFLQRFAAAVTALVAVLNVSSTTLWGKPIEWVPFVDIGNDLISLPKSLAIGTHWCSVTELGHGRYQVHVDGEIARHRVTTGALKSR